MTQRALAIRTRVAQPTVARIEIGAEIPRVDTLSRLLAVCGESLESLPRAGEGVDRTGIRELLRLTPRKRLEALAEESAAFDRLRASRRVR